jgi:hypothetical protein
MFSKICWYSSLPAARNGRGRSSGCGPLVPAIDTIQEADKTAPSKQRHTAKRIFERLRLEHGFAAGLYGGERLCSTGAHKAERGLRAARPSSRKWAREIAASARAPAYDQLGRAAAGEDEDCVRVTRMVGPDGRVGMRTSILAKASTSSSALAAEGRVRTAGQFVAGR